MPFHTENGNRSPGIGAMAGLAGKRGCLEGERRVCAGRMLHRSEGLRRSTLRGPAHPSHRGSRCSSGCCGKPLALVGPVLPRGAVLSWSWGRGAGCPDLPLRWAPTRLARDFPRSPSLRQPALGQGFPKGLPAGEARKEQEVQAWG